MSESTALDPPACLGVIGGGQLGRMFVLAAHAQGYRTVVLTEHPDGPAAQVAGEVIIAPSDCPPGGHMPTLRTLAERAEAVTLEFENISAPGVRWLERRVPVRPGWQSVWIAQNRIREKSFLSRNNFPVPFWRPIRNAVELAAAAELLSGSGILKTAASGYDGRGQVRVERASELAGAWEALNRVPCVVEAVVAFSVEVSCIVARGGEGATAVYPLFWNQHRRHILDVTVCPAPVGPSVTRKAQELARRVAEAVGLVGLLTVEFFVTEEGELLINELAPRPHNSGHLTIEAAETSQFAQQVRTLCGQPLGSTSLRRPAAMVNLLGDLWTDSGPPDWTAAHAVEPSAAIHLYGKPQARPGRKMGHLTILDDDPLAAASRAIAAREALSRDRTG